MKESKEIRDMEVNEPEIVKTRQEGIGYGWAAFLVASSGVLVILKLLGVKMSWFEVSIPVLVLVFLVLIALITFWAWKVNRRKND